MTELMERIAERLTQRGFEVHLTGNRADTRAKLLSLIQPGQRVGVGGSVSIRELDLGEALALNLLDQLPALFFFLIGQGAALDDHGIFLTIAVNSNAVLVGTLCHLGDYFCSRPYRIFLNCRFVHGISLPYLIFASTSPKSA